jgi:hypothetical protein
VVPVRVVRPPAPPRSRLPGARSSLPSPCPAGRARHLQAFAAWAAAARVSSGSTAQPCAAEVRGPPSERQAPGTRTFSSRRREGGSLECLQQGTGLSPPLGLQVGAGAPGVLSAADVQGWSAGQRCVLAEHARGSSSIPSTPK